jgi:hypothetical protein
MTAGVGTVAIIPAVMTLRALLSTLVRSITPWRRRTPCERLLERLATFRTPRLAVELVPATSWGANLRSALPQADWDRLRKRAYRAAGYRCEICRERGPAHPVECHELWEYDDSKGIQLLVGLIALCPGCHAVKHLGRSYAEGDGDAAFARLMRLNAWSAAVAKAYVDVVFEIWEIRSQTQWRLDLCWLATHGVPQPDCTMR